jgi:hypothetical protein
VPVMHFLFLIVGNLKKRCLHFFQNAHSTTQYKMTSKVDFVISLITDILCCSSAASECSDDWPEFVPLVQFAINDSATSLRKHLDRATPPSAMTGAGSIPAASAPFWSQLQQAHLG